MSSQFTIAQVATETGITKEVLRKWESRYGFPIPVRDSNGNRVYPLNQLERLKNIKRLLDDGRRPSQVVPLMDSPLSASLPIADAGDAAPPDDDSLHPVITWLRLRDPTALRENLHRQLRQRGLASFVRELMPEMNRCVGVAWEKGDIAVRDEHLYSEIVQTMLRESITSLRQPQGKPRILLTTTAGESHTLGLLMLEAIMSLEQAYCISLGAQSPLQEIAGAAVDFQAEIVALSFSEAFPKKQIQPLLRALRGSLPAEVKLWAGGSAVAGLERTPRGVSVLPLLDDAVEMLKKCRLERAQMRG